MGWTVERLIDEIDLLSSRGRPRAEFFAELSTAPQRHRQRCQLLAHA